MVQTRQYNYCLDFLKGIACVLVVFMHCEFPGAFGVYIQTVSRFCVPLFFAVSGYFCWGITTADALNRKVLHILRIIIFSSLFYLLFVLAQDLIWHDISFRIGPRKIINWILFNQPSIIVGQLWFLFALLYTYLLYALLVIFRKQKYIYTLGVASLIAYVCLAQGAHIAGISIPNCFYRNGWIEGFAFFSIGYWLHDHKDMLTIRNIILGLIVLVSTVMCLVKLKLIGRQFGVHICTIPQVIAMLVYAINNPQRHAGVLQRFGRDYSMLIYILHPFVWHSLERVYSTIGISGNSVALWLMPIVVLVLAILLAWICNLLYKYIYNIYIGRNTGENCHFAK